MPLSGQVALLRRFALVRATDATGVSGTGWVAFGVQWPSGKCTIEWWDRRSRGDYDTLATLLDVHGHDGATVVQWIDEAPDPLGSEVHA